MKGVNDIDFTEKKDVKQETGPETITVEELRMKILEEVMDLMCEKAKEYAKKHPEKMKKYKINFKNLKVEES